MTKVGERCLGKDFFARFCMRFLLWEMRGLRVSV